MRKILAVLILGAVAVLTSAPAFADDNADIRPLFFGDGFDNTTCVAYTVPAKCIAESLRVAPPLQDLLGPESRW